MHCCWSLLPALFRDVPGTVSSSTNLCGCWAMLSSSEPHIRRTRRRRSTRARRRIRRRRRRRRDAVGRTGGSRIAAIALMDSGDVFSSQAHSASGLSLCSIHAIGIFRCYKLICALCLPGLWEMAGGVVCGRRRRFRGQSPPRMPRLEAEAGSSCTVHKNSRIRNVAARGDPEIYARSSYSRVALPKARSPCDPGASLGYDLTLT